MAQNENISEQILGQIKALMGPIP